MLLPRPRAGGESFCAPSGQVHYLFWARNAIYHGLKALRIAPGDNVLVPSFHCASAIEPIVKYGARLTFYKVKRDCSVDFADLEAKIDKQTRAMLVIHYFGFPQAVRQIQQLCQDHRIYLIEDCAHVLSGEVVEGALGSFGDVSIFSWRKFLPIYDGGYLVINNPKLRVEMPSDKSSMLFSIKVAKNVFDKLIDDSVVKDISYLFRFPYWLARHLLSTNGSEANVLDINNRSLDFDMSLVNLKMSGLSRYILQHIDLSTVIGKRRVNYVYLLKTLGSIPAIVPAFRDLPEGICPWVFPVLARGQQNFHLTLRSKGIPASTWGGVIHPQLSLNEFPDAAFLYQNLVLLPVHQGLRAREMQTIIQVMSDALLGEASLHAYQLGGVL
jgi:dTDP-4-amino-4,6-dideoxygalactose transaminase